MSRIEELFNSLIDAFDIFLNIEEKEIGCLNEREHERFLADRNYYSQLLVEKLNGDMEQLTKENLMKSYPLLMETFNDDGGMGNSRRKRNKVEEYGR